MSTPDFTGFQHRFQYVHRYDVALDTREPVADFQVPRAGHHLVVMPTPSDGVRVCAVAGLTRLELRDYGHAAAECRTDTAEFFDDARNEWRLIDAWALPAPPSGCAACVL